MAEYISFNRQRRLEYRFRSHSWRTSFDFKSFPPEQPVNVIKIPHSSVRLSSTIIRSIEDDSEENLSSESSDDEYEEITSPLSATNLAEDDRLARLAEWEPGKTSSSIVESEEEENVEEKIVQIDSRDLPSEIPTSSVEDLLVTFVHYPVKNEPIIPQLDGQTDLISSKKKKISKYFSASDKSLSKHRKSKSYTRHSTEQKFNPPKRRTTNIVGRTLLDYFEVIKPSSTNCSSHPQIESTKNKPKKRSANYFDNCIVIDDDDDDDDTQPISTNITTREKLLDHAVHSSGMRIKWLRNVELILLEHISIYHEKQLDQSFAYPLNTSLISTIILNFLKLFIIRTSNHDEDELAFYQFGLTSYFRYLLLDLPMYQHEMSFEYAFILRLLFDVLFDLIEYDLCEIFNRTKPRSSLIEEDYFHQFKSKQNSSFYRIKFLIYFIELIALHRYRCTKSEEEEEEDLLLNSNQIFHWMEDFLQHILYQMNSLKNERLSICFNVMELCLLFIKEREHYVQQMALFLAKLCHENPLDFHVFLFDRNLSPDIRLLLIKELIQKKFHRQLISFEDFEEFFDFIQMSLKPPNPIDEMTLELLRSLFHTYADLIDSIPQSVSEQMISFFRDQLERIYSILLNLSGDFNYFESIKRPVILFRLLKCQWNRI